MVDRKKIARTISALPNIPPRLRPILFSAMNVMIGQNTTIAFPFEMYAGKFTIGDNSFINRHFYCDSGEVLIGNGVQIGPFVRFATTTHEMGPETQRAGRPYSETIIVEDGVWIGVGSTLLPGVKIARGCVVGANSLVTKSTEPNGLYIGSPARRVRDLD